MVNIEQYPSPRQGLRRLNDLYVGFKIYKLFNFDHSSQAYEADMKLFFEYNDLNYEGDGDYDSLESEALWKPHFYVSNSIGTPTNITRTIEYQKNKERKIKLNYRIQVKCHAVLDFATFPFDVQEICIAIGFPRFRSHIQSLTLLDNRNSGKAVIGGDLVEGKDDDIQLGMDDFELVRCYGTIRKAEYHLTKERDKTEYHVKVYLKRKYAYWIKLVYIPILSFSLSALIIFFFPIKDVEQRSDVLLTLLLTNVAIRISLAEKLPRIAYLTALDNILRSGSLFLFSLILYSVIVYRRFIDESEEPPNNNFNNTITNECNMNATMQYNQTESNTESGDYMNDFEKIEFFAFSLSFVWICMEVMKVLSRIANQGKRASNILLNEVNKSDVGLIPADSSMSIRDLVEEDGPETGSISDLIRKRFSSRLANKNRDNLGKSSKQKNRSCKTPRN